MVKRVVIIGGSGFLGLNLCEYLADCGYLTINCDQKYPHIIQENVAFVFMTKWSVLEDIIQENDIVIDLAFKGVPNSLNENWYENAEENIMGALKLINICIKNKAKRIIFASSGGAIYGLPQYVPIDENHSTLPISAYGIQKLAIEHYLRLTQKTYKIQTICLRISNLYGPGQIPFLGQGVIATFLANSLLDRPVEIWGTGEERRDYIFVKDVVESFEKALHYDGEEIIFNVGSGYGVSLNELILMIEEVLGKKVSRKYLSRSSTEVGANFLNCTKAQKILQWQPHTDLKQGLQAMLGAWEPIEQKFATNILL